MLVASLPPGAPPALAQVAQRFTATSRGFAVFRIHRVFDVHAGFSRRHEDLIMNGVYDDGTLVRVRVVSYVVNGRAAGASDIAAVEESWNHPKASDVFAPPFDPKNFAAYRYRAEPNSTIGFSSDLRDAGHGSGSFSYDAAGDVVAYTFVPNALPPHATSGTVMDRRAEVLPGYWASIAESQQYTGSYGPFAAAGAIAVTYSDFRRSSDLGSALSSL